MVTVKDALYQMIINSIKPPREAHYHLTYYKFHDSPMIMDMANFHIVDRTISMSQIGFDHYRNVVTYRV